MIYTLLRQYWLPVVLLLAFIAPAQAQLEAETASVANAPEAGVEGADEEAEPGDEPESLDLDDEPLVRSGDLLHLKSGQTLSDVQILRSTPRFFEVQFVDGLTMEVPRTQVDSVEWDNIDPLDVRRSQASTPVVSAASAVQGMEVGPELNEKLGLPVSDSPLIYLDEDVIVILESLTRRQSVAFEVDESVRALPIEERTLRLEINPSLTFEQLFLDRIPAALPGVVVVYEQDKVRLVTRVVAQQQKAPRPGIPGAANQQPAPPAGAETPPDAPPGEPPAPAPDAVPSLPAQADAPPATPASEAPPEATPGAETALPN